MAVPRPGLDRIKAVNRLDKPPTFIESSVGFLAASFFSLAYYCSPIYIFFVAPYLLIRAPFSVSTWVIISPIIISAILPSSRSDGFLGSWVMRMMPKYFNYTEILEYTDTELAQLAKKKPLILAAQPHGVISFGGISSALLDYSSEDMRAQIVALFPTAVASVLLSFPVLKHALGVFGLIDASKRSLTKHLKEKRKSAVLYVGGIAELFLSSPSEEIILARKGFIKLALTTGADIVPIYLFGNTTVLTVMRHPVLKSISRKLGASLTFFWGRWGLPLPACRPVTYVRGVPLGMPQIDEPTPENIQEWHDKYVAEVQRLFDTYKKYNHDFKDKTLKITDPGK